VGGHTAANLPHFQPPWPAAQATTPLPGHRPWRTAAKKLRMLIAQIVLIGTQLFRLSQFLAGGVQQVVVIDMANTRVPLGRQIGQKGETGTGRLGGLQGGFLAGQAATPQGGLIRVAGRYHLQLGAILIAGGLTHWHGYQGSLPFATRRGLRCFGHLHLIDTGVVSLFCRLPGTFGCFSW